MMDSKLNSLSRAGKGNLTAVYVSPSELRREAPRVSHQIQPSKNDAQLSDALAIERAWGLRPAK